VSLIQLEAEAASLRLSRREETWKSAEILILCQPADESCDQGAGACRRS